MILTCTAARLYLKSSLTFASVVDTRPRAGETVSMATRMVPDKRRLEYYLAQGLTQQQIVDQWEKDSNVRVSRSSIAMAIGRYGLASAKPRARYEDTLPWTVRTEHKNHYDARMLRLEGRRRRGGELSEADFRHLNEWKERLREAGAVVTYEPDTAQGFWWVLKNATDADNLIRRPDERKAG